VDITYRRIKDCLNPRYEDWHQALNTLSEKKRRLVAISPDYAVGFGVNEQDVLLFNQELIVGRFNLKTRKHVIDPHFKQEIVDFLRDSKVDMGI